jgi:peroxiredoxin
MNTHKRLTVFAVTGLILALAAVNTLLLRQNLSLRAQVIDLDAKLNPAVKNMHPGDEAQPFTSSDLEGRLSQVDYAGEGRKKIFIFFSPTCPYSAQQAGYWRQMMDEIDPARFEVVGITGEREDKQKVADFIQEMGYTSTKTPPHVMLVPDSVLRSYKLSSTPTTLVVSNDGHVENVWVGRWSFDSAQAAGSALNLTAH